MPSSRTYDSRLCYWLSDALTRDPGTASHSLRGSVTADICIVGGGVTGLWTALQLREQAPETRIVVLEAGICGQGASGRNAGFVMSWWSKFPSLAKKFGAQQAVEMCRLSADVVGTIGDFCKANRIAADFRRAGWLWVATNAAQCEAWAGTVDVLASAGQRPLVALSRAEAAERAGTNSVLGGVFEESVATVQPGMLVRGLRRTAIERGVVIYEHSPVSTLARSVPPEVHTASGSVRAQVMVIATGAWSGRIREIRRKLVITASDALATEPIPELLANRRIDAGMGITDSRRMINGYRATIDHRIVMTRGGTAIRPGGRLNGACDGASGRVPDLLSHLRHLFPDVAAAPIARTWRGPIDYSVSGLPWFGPIEPLRRDILIGVGYSGNGLGPSYLGASMLTAQALGKPVPTGLIPAMMEPPESNLPSEPFRYLGGQLVRKAIARKEACEDRDRRPDRLTAAIAALDPTSFSG